MHPAYIVRFAAIGRGIHAGICLWRNRRPLRLNPRADCGMWDAFGIHRPFRGDRSGRSCWNMPLAEVLILQMNPRADCGIYDRHALSVSRQLIGAFMLEYASGGSADLADESSRRLRDVGCIRYALSVSRRSVGALHLKNSGKRAALRMKTAEPFMNWRGQMGGDQQMHRPPKL